MTDLTDLAADYPAMQKARDEIAAIAESLTNEHRKLTTDMAAFLGGDWTGRAAESFRTHFDEWVHGADTLLAGLGTEATLIDETMRLIQAQDEHIVGDLNRLAQRLGTV